MGSPANEPVRQDREGPQRQVTVSGFYMGKYEVTQAEWQEVMGTNPSHFKGDSLPVESVSWFDAVEYCNRLSLREGLDPAYIVNGTEGRRYASGAQADPDGPSSGLNRIRRGGGWGSVAEIVRSAYRTTYAPSGRDSALGFRVARS